MDRNTGIPQFETPDPFPGEQFAVVNGGPRGDGKALAKTEEAPQALPEGIRSLTPEMLDFRKMKHRTRFVPFFPDPFFLLEKLKTGK